MSPTSAPTRPLVGQMAPQFSLPSLRGAMVDLASYRGRRNVVVWFSRGFTCPFCRVYTDGMRAGYEALRAADTEIIQVAPNLLDSARRFFAQSPLPFPFVCDPDKRLYAVYGLGDVGALEATKTAVVSFAHAFTHGDTDQPDPRRVVRRHEPQLRAPPAPPRDDGAGAGDVPHRQGRASSARHGGRPDRSRARRRASSPSWPAHHCGGDAGARVSQAERLDRLSEILIELFRSPIPDPLLPDARRPGRGRRAARLPRRVPRGSPRRAAISCTRSTGRRRAAPWRPACSRSHEGLPGRVMRDGPAVRDRRHRHADETIFDLEGALGQAGLRAGLVVPIRRGLDVLGALLFAARPPHVYGDDDAQVATLLAGGLSAALETSLAYQAAADERSTLAAVLASTADAVHHDQPGRRRAAGQRGRAPDARACRPTPSRGARCWRPSTTCRCASSSRWAGPAPRELAAARRAHGAGEPGAGRRRRSVSRSGWPPSCATSRCSRTSSR